MPATLGQEIADAGDMWLGLKLGTDIHDPPEHHTFKDQFFLFV